VVQIKLQVLIFHFAWVVQVHQFLIKQQTNVYVHPIPIYKKLMPQEHYLPLVRFVLHVPQALTKDLPVFKANANDVKERDLFITTILIHLVAFVI